MSQNCCVPNCRSNYSIPSHCFPKNPVLSEKWKNAVRSPIIDNLTVEKRRKYKVCYMHFTENAYMCSAVKRRLKSDVVPSENIPSSDLSLYNNRMPSTSTQNENDFTDNIINDVVEDNSSIINEIIPDNIMIRQSEENIPNINVVQRIQSKRNILGAVTRKKKLSATETSIHEKCVNLKKMTLSYKRRMVSYKQRIKDAKKAIFGKYGEQLASNMTASQKFFVQMQLRKKQFKARGRRFSTQEKILALSLYKQSPAAYRLYRRFFILPGIRTLKRVLQAVCIDTGINPVIIQHLKEKTVRMKKAEKLTVLLWDEVSLAPHLHYNHEKDKIIGCEDWHLERTGNIADHALVFMIKGIISYWKLPFAYYFSKCQTSTNQLMHCIKTVVKAVEEAGLIILATVCDQNTTNIAAVNKLLFDSQRLCWTEGTENRGTIRISQQNIIPIYDPPHLLKGIRNNLLNKNLDLDITIKKKENKKFAAWNVIEQAYKIDMSTNNISRLLPKITLCHVQKDKIPKMKVKYAAQIFSNSMAAYIELHSKIQGHVISQDGSLHTISSQYGLSTSEALKLFNDIFDSVNGTAVNKKRLHEDSHEISNSPLRTAITDSSLHHIFWPEAIQKLNIMEFEAGTTGKKQKRPPSLKNWIVTIQSFQKLYKTVKEYGCQSLTPKNINQDALENFFGMIRAYNFRNINPTIQQFTSTYKTLLLNNLTCDRSNKSNCEEDEGNNILFTLENFVNNCTTQHGPKKKNIFKIQPNVLLMIRSLSKIFHFDNPFINCVKCQEHKPIIWDIINNTYKIAHPIMQKYMNSKWHSYELSSEMLRELNAIISFTDKYICDIHYCNLKEIMLTTFVITFINIWCKESNRKINNK